MQHCHALVTIHPLPCNRCMAYAPASCPIPSLNEWACPCDDPIVATSVHQDAQAHGIYLASWECVHWAGGAEPPIALEGQPRLWSTLGYNCTGDMVSALWVYQPRGACGSSQNGALVLMLRPLHGTHPSLKPNQCHLPLYDPTLALALATCCSMQGCEQVKAHCTGEPVWSTAQFPAERDSCRRRDRTGKRAGEGENTT